MSAILLHAVCTLGSSTNQLQHSKYLNYYFVCEPEATFQFMSTQSFCYFSQLLLCVIIWCDCVYIIFNESILGIPQGWAKGVVFINGLNLGRYWSIGPQQALYLPGAFLNRGINQVTLFKHKMLLADMFSCGQITKFDLAGLV